MRRVKNTYQKNITNIRNTSPFLQSNTLFVIHFQLFQE